ncbi:MAG TPA: cytochrome c3 family protein, partial [Chthoniobacteraceae bacterium]|nr:cytochrome c3 family protein [Chthoniobacteraceae bacterium]
MADAGIAAGYEQTLPQVRVDTYVGSRACMECHKDEHASWHRTYHRTMTQVASPETVVADFNNTILTNDNTRFTLLTKKDELWVRMEPISGEGVGSGVETRMGLVTGSHHMQVFWVPEGHGNLQIGFPFTWLIPEKRWVLRNSTFIRPPGFDHRPEPWNIICSRCHTTGVEPRFHAATRSVDTHVGELGISCEACHGPGQKHVDLRTANRLNPNARLELNEIVHPEKLSAERSSQSCGFCHSMKWIDHNEDWRQHGFSFRPGDDLEKTTPIIRASSTNSIPGLAQYLARNPDILRDFFWSDGMIRVSGREFNGLIESPCYKGGKFSCLSCHSGHDNQPDDMLATRGKGNTACLQCHEKFNEPRQLTAHTRHGANSSGSECYNCHMPHTTYGVLKGIRSHQISSPRVTDDLQTGRPNACNLCHLDQTLNWTAQHLKAWYNQEVPQLPQQGRGTSHAIRLALAGDGGQRALVAWHFGWPPAQQASGTNWVAPLLGQLLDDPYAAVRIVAERSARSLDLLPGS